MPIKVCHMTSAHSSTDVRIFHKECASLAKAGYDVYLIARGKNREEKDVHIIGVGEPPSGRLSRMINFTNRVYKKALEVDADIYHFHDPELLPYGLKLKKKGKKVIFDSHEFYSLQINDKYYIPKIIRNLISKLYYKYETKVCLKIDAVIEVCTLNGYDYFQDRYAMRIFLANMAPLSLFYDKYSQDDWQNKEQAICYCGSLSESRGITALVKAAHQNGIKAILGGDFISAEYHKRLMSMPESECIEYLGKLKYEDVLKVYRRAKIGYSAFQDTGQYGKLDTLSTKAYELMGIGLPVIYSNFSYAKAVNEKYKCFYLVNNCDEKEITQAIESLIDHPEEAKQMGQNGRRAVYEEFNWENEEKKLLELYLSLEIS